MSAERESPTSLASQTFIFAGERSEDTQASTSFQAKRPTSPSPLAISAGRDLVFEGLVETGSLAESYSRSLTEAAWRGDQSTVEVHLRQLRACVVTSIGIFKQLDGGEAKREQP